MLKSNKNYLEHIDHTPITVYIYMLQCALPIAFSDKTKNRICNYATRRILLAIDGENLSLQKHKIKMRSPIRVKTKYAKQHTKMVKRVAFMIA